MVDDGTGVSTGTTSGWDVFSGTLGTPAGQTLPLPRGTESLRGGGGACHTSLPGSSKISHGSQKSSRPRPPGREVAFGESWRRWWRNADVLRLAAALLALEGEHAGRAVVAPAWPTTSAAWASGACLLRLRGAECTLAGEAPPVLAVVGLAASAALADCVTHTQSSLALRRCAQPAPMFSWCSSIARSR